MWKWQAQQSYKYFLRMRVLLRGDLPLVFSEEPASPWKSSKTIPISTDFSQSSIDSLTNMRPYALLGIKGGKSNQCTSNLLKLNNEIFQTHQIHQNHEIHLEKFSISFKHYLKLVNKNRRISSYYSSYTLSILPTCEQSKTCKKFSI